MDKCHLWILGMVRSTVNSAAGRRAHYNGDPNAPAKTALRSKINDLVVSAGNEVCKLHLDHRTKAHHRCPDGGSNNRALDHRRVDDALRSELIEHASGDFESASVDPDIFTQQDYVFVALQLFPNTLTDGFEVSRFAHA